MIKIIVICIMVGLLYIAISIILYPFNKQLNELENRILVLEKRIEDYKIENYKKYNDLYNTINVLIEYKKFENLAKYKKLEKKVKKNEK